MDSFHQIIEEYSQQIDQVEQKSNTSIDLNQYLKVDLDQFKKLLMYQKEIIKSKDEAIEEKNKLVDFYLQQNKIKQTEIK